MKDQPLSGDDLEKHYRGKRKEISQEEKLNARLVDMLVAAAFIGFIIWLVLYAD